MFADDKVILVDGQTFVFDMNEELGDAYRVRLPHPEILNTLRVGDFLLLGECTAMTTAYCRDSTPLFHHATCPSPCLSTLAGFLSDPS